MSSRLILSIDTTHEFGSLALLDGEETIDEILLYSQEGFGQILYGHIEHLLGYNDKRVRDVACFAAASGPGSFTGVRVGLACVKGLAHATGCPVAAVSNLEAMATFGTATLRAPVLDARRGEVYGAVYNAAGETVAAEVVAKFPHWLASLPRGELEFLALDFTPFHAGLSGTGFENAAITTVPRALAAAIGRIAFRRWTEGKTQDPATIDANYIRRSDAELLWKDN